MAIKTKAYIDSGAFIAFLDHSDSYHQHFLDLFAEADAVFTSAAVLIETHGWFLKRFDSRRAFQFLSFIESMKTLKVLSVEAADIKHAKAYLEKFQDQTLTLVDALGLHAMDKHRAVECWGTDRHLGLTGKRLTIYR